MIKRVAASFVLVSSFAVGMTATEEVKKEEFVFSDLKTLPITSIKNQNRSSTCWSFSGLGFLESELLRKGKGEFDLSEMFVVWHSYRDKGEKYVRLHGALNFSPGGAFYDVLQVVRDYGIVPDTIMNGLNYGETMHTHNELDAAAKAYMDVIVANKNGRLSTVWKSCYQGILNSYLGTPPQKFVYQGKEYTPESYAKSLDLNMEDYVSITSFTDHPFYTSFPLLVPDNWQWASSINVPMEEMHAILDNALAKGYTIAWAADVSELGFSRDGIAVVPDKDLSSMSGSDQARWTGLSEKDRNEELKKEIKPGMKEKVITQELRQQGYDNFSTTDDHGMIIYGTAKDQTGKPFYVIKNSWGINSKYEGKWFVSGAFFDYKTISIVLHKDAIPKDIRKKMGLK